VGCARVAAAIGFDFVRDRMLHFVVRGQWLAGGSAGAVQAAVRGLPQARAAAARLLATSAEPQEDRAAALPSARLRLLCELLRELARALVLATPDPAFVESTE
jgi:hypothetical protein